MREPLTPELVRELWSKTYNAEGKPDWSHIFGYYADDIVFTDSIQRVEGQADFTAMCDRLTQRCEKLTMDLHDVVAGDGVIFLEWTMTMVFRKAPSTPLHGCSKLTLDAAGQIVHQRDYFDLWGDIVNGIGPVKPTYRRFMRRLFG